ncbi:hypothetical protein E4U56_003764 [Claviceps arundinis]|uniref:Uncharacterized protein n=1 Tax=Claviceps arundinis TaxID=1623583 RepID=A0A9P7MPF6_9HYPO|nr:hypothetical protein E4U56_003764 [Claviceps arundinis]
MGRQKHKPYIRVVFESTVSALPSLLTIPSQESPATPVVGPQPPTSPAKRSIWKIARNTIVGIAKRVSNETTRILEENNPTNVQSRSGGRQQTTNYHHDF